jgi:hypothetical protein
MSGGAQSGSASAAILLVVSGGRRIRRKELSTAHHPKAEDGPIDAKYPLKETPSASYLQRTEWNVRDSDATVLFSIAPTLTGGSLRTMEFARNHGKPHLHLCAGNDTSADDLRAFFEYHDVKVLNVAGPRASKEPKVGQFVMALLDEVLGVPN